MLLALRILLCIIGASLLSLGLFVYEDEEKGIQSRLEDYWIKLDDQRRKAVVTEQLLIVRAFAFISRTRDNWFGQELFSILAVLMSIGDRH